MNILHIARINNNLANGIAQVVPKYLEMQNLSNTAALLNYGISDLLIDKNFTHFDYRDYLNGNINLLPSPFNEPDLIVFHELYHPYFLKVWFHIRKKRIPYIILPHGGLSKHAQNKKRVKKTIANNIVFRPYLRGAASIQFLNDNEYKSSITINKNSPIISGNGMEVALREKKNVDEEQFIITYIGRLDIYHKGLDLLVEAVSQCSGQTKNKLQINLYGPDRDNGIEKLTLLINKYNLDNIINIHGPIFGYEKKSVLDSTDIFVLPSRFEGQPLAGIESICSGIPIIASHGTNLTNDIEKYKCGWVCDTSAESLSQAIETAYKERTSISILSSNCFQCALECFDWLTITNKLLLDYQKIVEAKEFN